MPKKIYCCSCSGIVSARLTNGKEIYSHREDLHDLPFWKCDGCGNYVGCHHKTKKRTKPLGNIPNAKLRSARSHIHKILDPIWQNNIVSRGQLYMQLNIILGYEYHTAQIKTVEEARIVYKAVQSIKRYYA